MLAVTLGVPERRLMEVDRNLSGTRLNRCYDARTILSTLPARSEVLTPLEETPSYTVYLP